jgi:hypothetical protein
MHRIVLGGLVALVAGGAAQAGATAYFRELVKDFGTTPRGPVLQHYFTVTNTSGQPVTIGQPRVSCGCVSATVLNPQLAPGQSTAVLANMDTNRIPTPGVTKSVIIFVPFLSPVAEEVQLRVQTVTRTDLIITPDTLAFGTVAKGKAATATTKLTFYSDPNWQITSAVSTGVYLTAAVAKAAGPAATYDLTVTLKPDCPVGNWTADIELTTTGAGIQRLRVPVMVTVVPGVSANPPTVAFGTVSVGKPTERQVVLQGVGPFSVTGVKGGNGVEVAPVPSGAKASHVLKLSLNPTTPGPVSARVEVTTDSKDQPTVSLPVTATVVK